jgi:hypothetical protein
MRRRGKFPKTDFELKSDEVVRLYFNSDLCLDLLYERRALVILLNSKNFLTSLDALCVQQVFLCLFYFSLSRNAALSCSSGVWQQIIILVGSSTILFFCPFYIYLPPLAWYKFDI